MEVAERLGLSCTKEVIGDVGHVMVFKLDCHRRNIAGQMGRATRAKAEVGGQASWEVLALTIAVRTWLSAETRGRITLVSDSAKGYYVAS